MENGTKYKNNGEGLLGENRRKEYVSISGETKYVEKGINRENV